MNHVNKNKRVCDDESDGTIDGTLYSVLQTHFTRYQKVIASFNMQSYLN